MARRVWLAGVLVAGLAACGGGDPDAGAPRRDILANAQAPCPRVAILAEAADLTRFRPGAGTDLGAMVLDAKVAGFSVTCDYAPRQAGLDVTLTLTLNAERGPAAEARSFDLTYLVAVLGSDEREVLSREQFTARATFPPNVSRLRTQGEQISIRLPGNPRVAAQRSILVGFALTPEELENNRRRRNR